MNEYIEVIIKKPLYSYNGADFVNIRDKYLRQAQKEGKLLRIVTPNGVHYTTANEWKKDGKKVEQVFKFKDRPMKLVGNYATPNDPPEEEKITMDNYLKNMSRLRDIAKSRGII